MMTTQRILEGAGALKIEMTPAQAEKFARYHELLAEANQKMNLTRIPMDDPEEAIDRHYLDSIAPLSVPGLVGGVDRLIDVGSGAGLPGIPLAIMRPDIRVVLLDSLQKRVKFLNEVIQALGLNAEAVHARAEDAAHLPEYRERFELVTARAVASLPQLLELTLPFVRVGGHLIAYKGPSLPEELEGAKHAMSHLGGGNEKVHPIEIPGRDWNHQLLEIQKRRPSPKPYPRKPAEITRKPL